MDETADYTRFETGKNPKVRLRKGLRSRERRLIPEKAVNHNEHNENNERNVKTVSYILSANHPLGEAWKLSMPLLLVVSSALP